jgi:hypothetical protein
VEWRHVEALRLLYLADSQVASLFGTNVHLGPASDDPDAESDNIVRPPQLNVMLSPDFGIEVEVGGAGNQFIPVVTAYYEHPNVAPYSPGALGGPIDVMVYLQTLQMKGSGEGNPIQFNNQGKLINPDTHDVNNTVEHYLNVAPPDFRTLRTGTKVKGNVARLFAFVSLYLTEVDNITRVRI